MSAIHCPVCGGGNPPGSKFCNNCGSPLPPETHIICPNCQHYNPLHLLYCDTCGTRLVPEDSAAEPSPPEREQPPAPKAFNLPTRATDDTGELKLPPLRQPAIHDWLKDSDPTDAAPTMPPPKPLPTAPEPLEPDAEATDPAFADFARWLEDIRVEENAEEPDEAPPPPAEAPAAADVTTGADSDNEVVSPRNDLPEWLRAAAPRGTGILSSPPRDAFGSVPPPPELDSATDVPDWLAEIAPPGTGMLTTKRNLGDDDIFDALAAEFELPDWLRHPDKSPENKVEPPPGQTPPAPARQGDDEEISIPQKPEGTPDWLAQFAAAESDAAPSQMAAEALPDWLAELELDTQTTLPETELPDWLAAAEPAPPEPDEPGLAEAHLPDWLAPLAAKAPGSPPPEAPPSAVAEQPIEPEAASWLSATPPEESFVAPAEPTAPAGSDETTGVKPLSWPHVQDEAALDSAQATLLAAERTAAGDFPDWLQEVEEAATEEEAQAELPDWLAAVDTEEQESEDLAIGLTFTPASLAEDLPDWFDTLFRDGTLEETAPAADAGAELLPGWLTEFADEVVLTEAAAEAEASVKAEVTAETEAVAEAASIDIASFEQGEPEQVEPADLLGWLSHLPAAQTPAEFDADPGLGDLAGDEWLAEAWPAGESAAAPPADQLVKETDELASAELPDWLQDSLRRSPDDAGAPSLTDLFAASESRETPAGAKLTDLPDWLQPSDADSFDAALQAALSSRNEAGPTFGAGDEWSDVLEAMPGDGLDITLPSASEFAGMGAAASELVAADIPEWLQPFKPHELRAPGEIYAPTEPVQETGPLAGMRGVIDIEPVIAQPRQADNELPQFTVTPMQRQQASLLRQLAQASPAPMMAADAVQQPAMPVWLRLLLALLLLAALITAALLPNLVNDLVGTAAAALPAGAAAANEIIEVAAGQPVLVAFDYTPAMKGELGPAAQLLLAQLATNGSPVLSISQSAAGVTLAGQAMGQTADLNGTNLGYLPGEAVGLRLLGQCVAAPDSCQTIAGSPLALNRSGEPVGLIILITADQENLINWVEQVGSASQTPLLAVVTQSLSPAAGPYYASGQLAGLIEGLPAAAAYERLVNGAAGPVTALSHTQALAYWLVILLLVGGNLIYLAASLLSRRRGQ